MNKKTKTGTPGGGKTSFFGAMKQWLWTDLTKWGKFGVILVALVAISTLASLIARVTYFKPDYKGTYHIALIAPLSGPSKQIGQSLQRGAELYARHFNEQGGLDGRYVRVKAFDDAGDPARARALAEKIRDDAKVVAVVGPWSAESAGEAASVLDGTDLAAMTIAPSAYDLAGKHKSLFALAYSQDDETRFLANYMRNVMGEKLASIVTDERAFTGMADLFAKTFERFGVPIRNRWTFDSSAGDATARLAEIATKIKEATDSGAVFLAMGEREAAQLIKLMRDTKTVNKVMGPHMLGTQAFAAAFGSADFRTYTNGVITAAPLMFDTANQKVQNFRSDYLKTYKTAPDWIAAYGYAGANIFGQAMLDLQTRNEGKLPDGLRRQIRDYVSSRNRKELAIDGMTGRTVFSPEGVSSTPIQVGVYDGPFVISALTQLQPIGTGEVSNYIQAVRDGRALYVNNRFMYKTNVVYTGILINQIRDYDPLTRTFEMDFVIWFRYSGDFNPEDVIFKNAVEPIKLEKPDRTEKIGDLTYRRYKITTKFTANFLNTRRNYGSELLGTSFRHRVLNQNNLVYVVDVVGIGLTGGGTYLDRVREGKILKPALGLVAERAWISQDIVRASGLGDPTFVGHGKPAPDFSQIDVGVVTKEATVSLRDTVPNEYLIYLLIFAFLGALFAIFMDRKKSGNQLFFSVQSWLLRLISWPAFLIAAGSLALNFAFQNLEFYFVDLMVPVYEGLWWVLGALLIAMAVERFVWVPLEHRTDRKVPGAVRAVTTVVIFMFAAFGIIAFVLHQELTSLLATSGLLAAIIGLAVQSNISNIFSGIVLNLERPFRTGDWIEVGDTPVGQVTDITWRSTQIETFGKSLISLPNGKVAESQIENFSHPRKNFRIYQVLHFDTNLDPKRITELIYEGLDNAKCIDGRDDFEFKWVKMVEVDEIGFKFVCVFDCIDREVKNSQDHEVLVSVADALRKDGIHVKTQLAELGR